jgi:hypothetical protein
MLMLKPLGRIALLVALVVTPSTGLKYTLHMEAHQAANAAQDPLSSMMAGLMSGVFPEGGLDQAIAVSERGTRSEQKQAFSGLPAGTVTITRPDGTAVGMDPAAKTFWKQTSGIDVAAATMAQLPAKPDVKVKKTGEFETIEGMKAERVNVSLGLPLPISPDQLSQLPPGFPTSLTITMDVWVTDAIKVPSTNTALADSMLTKFLPDQSGLKELNDGRFMLKTVMNMFGVEMVTTVKDIVKGDVADSLFEVPKDFKEVPPPGGGGLPAFALLASDSAKASSDKSARQAQSRGF